MGRRFNNIIKVRFCQVSEKINLSCDVNNFNIKLVCLSDEKITKISALPNFYLKSLAKQEKSVSSGRFDKCSRFFF
jgi:hypothetical protein